MKKFFTITLAIVMMMAMSTTAFAADGSSTKENGGVQEIPVNAKYNGSYTPEEKVSVEVKWGAMEFTYNVSGTQTWNPDSHTYTNTDKGTPSWTANGNTVKVTNHSNVAVKATFDYTKIDGNVQGEFAYDNGKAVDKDGAIALTAGVVEQPGAADYVTATLTLSGRLSSTSNKDAQVGTITVKISK